jgi:HAMP domain-containing protein
LIDQKSKEITNDIFIQARSFSEMTVSDIVDNYNLYYQSQSFVFFNREIKNIFALNPDIAAIKIANYNGELLYDSENETNQQYLGERRKIEDQELMIRLQDVKPSIKTEERIVYLIKNTSDGSYRFTDHDEQAVLPIQDTEQVINIVYPYSDDQTRVIYSISYENLQQRIENTIKRIVFILILTSIAGIFIAIIFASRIIQPIKKLTKGVSEIAKGNLTYQVEVFVKDEIKTLADGFNKMAKDLEISTRAMIEKEKLSKELEIAGKIQQNLLPQVPTIAGLDMAASVTPAEAVGGDCYDFLKLDDQNHLIYLGDVTGHGVPASLVVAITNSLFYTMLEFFKNTKDIIVHTNKILKAKTEANMFVTAVLCNWNTTTNTFRYTSAGHEQIIHYHAADQSVSLCPAGGMALGMLPDISALVQEQEVKVADNDVLFLYSDGIPEAWKNEKEMLGMKTFQNIIQTICQKFVSALEIHNQIIKEVREFMGEYPQADDITLIVIKRIKE